MIVNFLISSHRISIYILRLDVVLSSPVLVLPKSCESADVLVANLGKITICNQRENIESPTVACRNTKIDSWTKDTYFIDVRNINLFSLNTAKRKELKINILPKANEYYSCKNDAVAILYDTALIFQCIYESKTVKVDTKWSYEYKFLVSIPYDFIFRLQCAYEYIRVGRKYFTIFKILDDCVENVKIKMRQR